MHAGGGNCGRHSIDLTAKKEYDYEYEEGKLTRADECNIVLSGGRTISYEYDAEERITKVVDSVDGTTEYTYDALGQLLTETVNGLVVPTNSVGTEPEGRLEIVGLSSRYDNRFDNRVDIFIYREIKTHPHNTLRIQRRLVRRYSYDATCLQNIN